MISLGAVESLTVGAVGQPGERTFYLQATAGDTVYSFLVEKQQVAALAGRSLELLRELGVTAPAEPPHGSEMTDPEDVVFRVGELAIAYEPSSEAVTLGLRSVDEDDEPVELEATLEQLATMAAAGAAAAAAGRPLCPRCNLAEDPEGHVCPASNGDLRRHRP